jgi:hypothetical protein
MPSFLTVFSDAGVCTMECFFVPMLNIPLTTFVAFDPRYGIFDSRHEMPRVFHFYFGGDLGAVYICVL